MHKSRKPLTPNHKCSVGPGGINCPCCTRVKPTKLKKLTRRLERVFFKRELARLVADAIREDLE